MPPVATPGVANPLTRPEDALASRSTAASPDAARPIPRWREPALVLAAAIVGALAFAYAIPLGVLDPTNIRWMMKADRSAQLLGWLFFRNESWRFPLGAIHSMVFPLTTTVGYSDALPWVAVPAKLLFGWVSGPFQYSGAFLLACYVLQGVFGFLLLRALAVRPALSIVGAAFFAYAPILLQRYEHISLCAQWQLLAAWWLYCRRPVSERPWRMLAPWLLLITLAVLTYVYLAAMILVIAAAAYVRAVRHDRVLSVRTALRHWAAIAGVVLVTLWVWGFFIVQHRGDPGFGTYSADLLAFFDPGPWSAYLKPLASVRRNYETFDYLGAGVIVLLIACVALRIGDRSGGADAGRARPDRPTGLPPLGAAIAAAVVMCVYALATPIRFGGHDVLRVPVYAPLSALTSAFRGSARFTWPAYYLLLAGVLAALDRRLGRRAALAVALAALALQVADLRPLRQALRTDYSYPWPRLESPLWRGIGRSYGALRLLPPIIAHRQGCPPYGQPDDYEIRFGVVAATEHMRFNSAALARADNIPRLCDAMIDSLAHGLVDPATVYIPNDWFREDMARWARDALVCGIIDGANVCVSRGGSSPLAGWLRTHESPRVAPRLAIDLSNLAAALLVDSAPGFAPAGPAGRLILDSAGGARLYFTRPFDRPLTVHVVASAAGALVPVPLSIALGTESRTVPVTADGLPATVRFGGGPDASVLRFRAPRVAPGWPTAPAASADTMGVRVKTVVIELQ